MSHRFIIKYILFLLLFFVECFSEVEDFENYNLLESEYDNDLLVSEADNILIDDGFTTEQIDLILNEDNLTDDYCPNSDFENVNIMQLKIFFYP
jgi:hypothetical protein